MRQAVNQGYAADCAEVFAQIFVIFTCCELFQWLNGLSALVMSFSVAEWAIRFGEASSELWPKPIPTRCNSRRRGLSITFVR